jgi:hypothetical protein
MRNKLVSLIVCGFTLIAAEKNRDWQMGQVVDSADQTSDARIHTIASKTKNYVVRGSIGDTDDALAAGASIRFAVEGKTMFVSMPGREYKLYVLGERVATLKEVEPPPPNTPAAKPVVAPITPAPATPAPVVQVQAPDALDNDAVVKMIVGGLKEETVVSVIQARPGRYTLTTDALTGLRAAGVSQSVIAAMSAKMNTRK